MRDNFNKDTRELENLVRIYWTRHSRRVNRLLRIPNNNMRFFNGFRNFLSTLGNDLIDRTLETVAESLEVKPDDISHVDKTNRIDPIREILEAITWVEAKPDNLVHLVNARNTVFSALSTIKLIPSKDAMDQTLVTTASSILEKIDSLIAQYRRKLDTDCTPTTFIMSGKVSH